MPKKTGLACALAAMLYLSCSLAAAADTSDAQPTPPPSEVEKTPEKQPITKEEATKPDSAKDAAAPPKTDPNCE